MIQNQLSAPRLERLQIRIGRVQRARRFFLGQLQSRFDRERLVIPVRTLHTPCSRSIRSPKNAIRLFPGAGPSNPESPSALPIFRARQKAREDFMSMRIVRPGINLLQRDDLRRGQALVRVFARLALNGRRIEVALPRIVQDSVAHAVKFVAGREHRRRDRRNFRLRNKTRRRRAVRACVSARRGREQRSPVVRRSPRQNSVIVRGIALRLHQRFAPAIGASRKIRMLRSLPVERVHHLLGDPRHLVNSAMTEVHDFLRMPQRPRRIDRRSRRVRCRCAVAAYPLLTAAPSAM